MSTASAAYHIVGRTAAGTIGQTVHVTSGADYHNALGGRTATSAIVYDDVTTFLAEGGRDVYITRVADTATPHEYAIALDAAGTVSPGAAVAVPELPLGLIGVRLLAHAEAHGKVALLNGRQDDDAQTVAFYTQPLIGRPGSDAAGVFWPWVSITDRETGRSHHRPPTGYVAAVRARAHLAAGYWANPDGRASTAHTLDALRFPNTPARNEELSEQLVSPLVTTREGVQLHGWWSLSGDRANFPYLDTRDLLNNIAAELQDAYETVTAHTWDTVSKNVGQITGLTKSILASAAKGGAFNAKAGPEGTAGDPGYHFTVTLPTPQPPDRNTVTVTVYVRPRTHAVLIGVRTFRVPIHVSLSERTATP